MAPELTRLFDLRFINLVQGLFYLLTGLWPMVSIKTFMYVTGPKTDLWLVKTVGVLVSVIGSVLLLASRRRKVSPEITLLAASSAAGLAGIDIIYVAKKRISSVYLLDAVVELIIVGLQAAGWRRQARQADKQGSKKI